MTAAELLEKHSCDIVEDLLPYYAEHLLELPSTADDMTIPSSFLDDEENFSAAAKARNPAFFYVETHIKCCEHCRSLLEMISEDWKEPKQAATNPPTIRFRKKYQLRLALGTAFAILTAAGILAILL